MELQFTINEINEVAHKIIELKPKKVIIFNGEMGVGKTTLIKEIAKVLGVNDTTSSPTFSLVNEYQTTDDETIYHFDCYRLKSETEALDMGIEEYLYSGNLCFIEWPEKITNLLPEEYSKISITQTFDGKRDLKFEI